MHLLSAEIDLENTTLRSYATVTLTSGEVISLTPDDFTATNNYTIDGLGVSTFPIGAAIEKQAQIELYNDGQKYNALDLANAMIDIFVGDGTSTINKGRFTVVTTPEAQDDTVLLTAFDDMYKADTVSSIATAGKTLGTILNECCTACGITLKSGGFTRDSVTVQGTPTTSTTYRQLIAMVAMLAGGNARINVENELEIIPLTFTGTRETLSEWNGAPTIGVNDTTVTGIYMTAYYKTYEYDTVEDYDEEGEVVGTHQELSETTTVESPTQWGSAVYSLTLENDLLTNEVEDSRDAVSEFGAYIYSAICNTSFRTFSGDLFSNPLLEFMDLVTVQDRLGNTYNSFITDIQDNVLGNTTVSCNVPSMSSKSSDLYSMLVEAKAYTNSAVSQAKGEFTEVATEKITAVDANLKNLIAKKATVEDLKAEAAKVDYLNATNVEINLLTVVTSYVQNLGADEATVEDLLAENLTADEVTAAMATINELKAQSATVETIAAALVDASIISADSANITNLSAKKADIDFANVIALEASTAVIQGLLQAGGIMTDDITAVTGEFTQYLTGVNISGDLINAGTISTERLIIRSSDTDEGILFAINDAGEIDQTTLTAEELKRLTLDGKLITAGTITADKIAVTDLSAFNATIGGFNLTKASIYSTNEKIILNADGTFKLGDGIQYDGTDMTIQAKTITMGGESLATATEVQVLQDQIDGAIETYFDSYVPTLETEPTSTWSTDDYDKHLGDLFYIVNNDEKNGQVYRFALIDGTYQWVLLSDAELTKALNDAADALSAAQAAQSTADSAKEDAATAQTAAANAQDAIDDLSVGARNLFLSSGFSEGLTLVANSSLDWSKPLTYYSANTGVYSYYDGSVQQITFTLTSTSNIGLTFKRLASDIDLDPDATYTMSAWVKVSVAGAKVGRVLTYYSTSSTWVWRGGQRAVTIADADTWTHIQLSFKPDADTYGICYGFTCNYGNNATFSIRHAKLEKGSIATDWTPAPEDLKSATDAAQTSADAAQTNALTALTSAQNAAEVAATAQSTADNIGSTLSEWFVFSDTDGLLIGRLGSKGILRLSSEKIQFLGSSTKDSNGDFIDVLGYWDIENDEFKVGNISVDIDRYVKFGNYAFYPRTDGSLHIKKIIS